MKNLTILLTLMLCLCAAPVLSGEFFFEKLDESDENAIYGYVDINEVRANYGLLLSRLSDALFSNVFRTLLGEKEMLDKEITDLFQLAQVNNMYLRMLRNMIYARHGLIFSSDDLNTYFRKIDWYKPEHQNVNSRLTEADRHNVKIIQAFETRDENLPNVNWGDVNGRVGVWQQGRWGRGESLGNTFTISPDNKMAYHVSEWKHELNYMGLLHSLAGVYSIKGNVLEFRANEISYYIPHNFNIKLYASGYDWDSVTVNRARLEKPIVYKFPISEISTVSVGDSSRAVERQRVTIGGVHFYKLEPSESSRSKKP
jgi:hypothetical protein